MKIDLPPKVWNHIQFKTSLKSLVGRHQSAAAAAKSSSHFYYRRKPESEYFKIFRRRTSADKKMISLDDVGGKYPESVGALYNESNKFAYDFNVDAKGIKDHFLPIKEPTAVAQYFVRGLQEYERVIMWEKVYMDNYAVDSETKKLLDMPKQWACNDILSLDRILQSPDSEIVLSYLACMYTSALDLRRTVVVGLSDSDGEKNKDSGSDMEEVSTNLKDYDALAAKILKLSATLKNNEERISLDNAIQFALDPDLPDLEYNDNAEPIYTEDPRKQFSIEYSYKTLRTVSREIDYRENVMENAEAVSAGSAAGVTKKQLFELESYVQSSILDQLVKCPVTGIQAAFEKAKCPLGKFLTGIIKLICVGQLFAMVFTEKDPEDSSILGMVSGDSTSSDSSEKSTSSSKDASQQDAVVSLHSFSYFRKLYGNKENDYKKGDASMKKTNNITNPINDDIDLYTSHVESYLGGMAGRVDQKKKDFAMSKNLARYVLEKHYWSRVTEGEQVPKSLSFKQLMVYTLYRAYQNLDTMWGRDPLIQKVVVEAFISSKWKTSHNLAVVEYLMEEVDVDRLYKDAGVEEIEIAVEKETLSSEKASGTRSSGKPGERGTEHEDSESCQKLTETTALTRGIQAAIDFYHHYSNDSNSSYFEWKPEGGVGRAIETDQKGQKKDGGSGKTKNGGLTDSLLSWWSSDTATGEKKKSDQQAKNSVNLVNDATTMNFHYSNNATTALFPTVPSSDDYQDAELPKLDLIQTVEQINTGNTMRNGKLLLTNDDDRWQIFGMPGRHEEYQLQWAMLIGDAAGVLFYHIPRILKVLRDKIAAEAVSLTSDSASSQKSKKPDDSTTQLILKKKLLPLRFLNGYWALLLNVLQLSAGRMLDWEKLSGNFDKQFRQLSLSSMLHSKVRIFSLLSMLDILTWHRFGWVRSLWYEDLVNPEPWLTQKNLDEAGLLPLNTNVKTSGRYYNENGFSAELVDAMGDLKAAGLGISWSDERLAKEKARVLELKSNPDVSKSDIINIRSLRTKIAKVPLNNEALQEWGRIFGVKQFEERVLKELKTANSVGKSSTEKTSKELSETSKKTDSEEKVLPNRQSLMSRFHYIRLMQRIHHWLKETRFTRGRDVVYFSFTFGSSASRRSHRGFFRRLARSGVRHYMFGHFAQFPYDSGYQKSTDPSLSKSAGRSTKLRRSADHGFKASLAKGREIDLSENPEYGMIDGHQSCLENMHWIETNRRIRRDYPTPADQKVLDEFDNLQTVWPDTNSIFNTNGRDQYRMSNTPVMVYDLGLSKDGGLDVRGGQATLASSKNGGGKSGSGSKSSASNTKEGSKGGNKGSPDSGEKEEPEEYGHGYGEGANAGMLSVEDFSFPNSRLNLLCFLLPSENSPKMPIDSAMIGKNHVALILSRLGVDYVVSDADIVYVNDPSKWLIRQAYGQLPGHATTTIRKPPGNFIMRKELEYVDERHPKTGEIIYDEQTGLPKKDPNYAMTRTEARFDRLKHEEQVQRQFRALDWNNGAGGDSVRDLLTIPASIESVPRMQMRTQKKVWELAAAEQEAWKNGRPEKVSTNEAYLRAKMMPNSRHILEGSQKEWVEFSEFQNVRRIAVHGWKLNYTTFDLDKNRIDTGGPPLHYNADGDPAIWGSSEFLVSEHWDSMSANNGFFFVRSSIKSLKAMLDYNRWMHYIPFGHDQTGFDSFVCLHERGEPCAPESNWDRNRTRPGDRMRSVKHKFGDKDWERNEDGGEEWFFKERLLQRKGSVKGKKKTTSEKSSQSSSSTESAENVKSATSLTTDGATTSSDSKTRTPIIPNSKLSSLFPKRISHTNQRPYRICPLVSNLNLNMFPSGHGYSENPKLFTPYIFHITGGTLRDKIQRSTILMSIDDAELMDISPFLEQCRLYALNNPVDSLDTIRSVLVTHDLRYPLIDFLVNNGQFIQAMEIDRNAEIIDELEEAIMIGGSIMIPGESSEINSTGSLTSGANNSLQNLSTNLGQLFKQKLSYPQKKYHKWYAKLKQPRIFMDGALANAGKGDIRNCRNFYYFKKSNGDADGNGGKVNDVLPSATLGRM